MPASSLGPKDTFVFRNNSAGMGVPRGSLGKLNSFSGQTAQHGMATTNVYYGGASGVKRQGRQIGQCWVKFVRQTNSSAGSNRTAPIPAAAVVNMQSASPGAGAAHSSMQSGVGGGGGTAVDASP